MTLLLAALFEIFAGFAAFRRRIYRLAMAAFFAGGFAAALFLRDVAHVLVPR